MIYRFIYRIEGGIMTPDREQPEQEFQRLVASGVLTPGGLVIQRTKEEALMHQLMALTGEQRLEIFSKFCMSCGRVEPDDGPRCQCGNDE